LSHRSVLRKKASLNPWKRKEKVRATLSGRKKGTLLHPKRGKRKKVRWIPISGGMSHLIEREEQQYFSEIKKESRTDHV